MQLLLITHMDLVTRSGSYSSLAARTSSWWQGRRIIQSPWQANVCHHKVTGEAIIRQASYTQVPLYLVVLVVLFFSSSSSSVFFSSSCFFFFRLFCSLLVSRMPHSSFNCKRILILAPSELRQVLCVFKEWSVLTWHHSWMGSQSMKRKQKSQQPDVPSRDWSVKKRVKCKRV